MANFSAMNETYARFFTQGVRPVSSLLLKYGDSLTLANKIRTCVAVKELPFGADVEIEASAHL
jgi:enamine deaminase RidA (YjgF/YER057c/UK114 family)